MSSFSGTAPIGNEAIAAAMRSGNINIAANISVEVMDLSAESREAQQKHAEALRKIEMQQRARTIVVPTAPEEVKSKLRELRQPITLFGEGPADRRDRLREIIASLNLSEEERDKIQKLLNQPGAAPTESQKRSAPHGAQQKETVYSLGSEELIAARRLIADFSFRRARVRLETTRRIRESIVEQAAEDERALKLYQYTREMCLNSTQCGDTRPLTAVKYGPVIEVNSGSSGLLAVGSLSCEVSLWDSLSLNNRGRLKGHEERITSIAWRPVGALDSAFLASSSADATCILWRLEADQTDMAVDDTQGGVSGHIAAHLKGHAGVVADCAFHPCGDYLATASHDTTWRLWDVHVGAEILLQDGHTKECGALCFHSDGSLVLSTDCGGTALLWDIRSGQMIHAFQGHIRKITCAEFSPNGFQVATGSVDNMIRIWDLRKRKCGYCLPAHSNAISGLSYTSSGEVLYTSSFDGAIKAWRTRDHERLGTFTGHTGKIMAFDVATDEKHIASVGYDRSIKLWAHKSEF